MKTNTQQIVKQYRKERWNKALKKAEGNKKKAYKFMIQQDFY